MINFLNKAGDRYKIPKHLFESLVKTAHDSYFIRFNGILEELDYDGYQSVLEQL